MYPCEEYPYRATLVKEPNEPWKVLEYNCLYAEKEDPLEVLPIGEPGIVLTVVSKSQIVPNMVEDPIKEFAKFRSTPELAHLLVHKQPKLNGFICPLLTSKGAKCIAFEDSV